MGMRFVWGGQFGWGHFEPLLKKENRALMDYFAQLCRLRRDYGSVFGRGEFLRPPAVKANGAVCTSPLKGPVLAAMWGDPDAPRAVVFLVNVTRTAQRVRVCVADSRWRQARIAKAAGVMPLAATAKSAGFETRLAPLAVLAVPGTLIVPGFGRRKIQTCRIRSVTGCRRNRPSTSSGGGRRGSGCL